MDMTDDEKLQQAWARTQASLPVGWTLDGLRCASTGLATEERSDDWIAVAVGPLAEEREASAVDPFKAMDALVSSFERGDRVRASQ